MSTLAVSPVSFNQDKFGNGPVFEAQRALPVAKSPPKLRSEVLPETIHDQMPQENNTTTELPAPEADEKQTNTDLDVNVEVPVETGTCSKEIPPTVENKQNNFSKCNNARKQETDKVNREGPNKVAPTESLWTSDRDGPVKLRMEAEGPRGLRPLSVMTAFQEIVTKYPDHLAMATKVNGAWRSWSYRMYYDDVWRAAKAFIKLGLEPRQGVGIIGFNSPEWFISNFAAVFAGGLSTGIYTTNSPEACQYVANHAKCNIIVVENDSQLQKILKVRDSLPDLKAIIQYHGEPKEKYPNVYSWLELMTVGEDEGDEQLQQRIRQQYVNKCCTLIYTSGTTGNPKGVMLSHDNLTWTARMAIQTVGLETGVESLVSYLPLSHVAAQILDMYIPVLCAAAVYFSQPDALKGSLVDTLKEVRPTAFLGVPRVWEKMQDKLTSISSKQGWFKKGIFSWATNIGLVGNLSRMSGGNVPFGWRLANMLVFKKIRGAMGLDRCKICMTAAAPIMRDTLDFFAGLDIPIMEIFGMSESSGPHTISTSRKWRLGSVGPCMLGASVNIIGEGITKTDGEICLGGRNVFMGYLDEETKTVETIDTSGFLHSGDVGRIDNEGLLYITGRIKELLITAGGENVAPVPIEDAVQEALPCVSNCMLVGDRKKFLSILLTLKTEVDRDTSMPLDKLTPACREWCKAHNCDVSTVSEVLDKPDGPVMHALQEGINAANKQAVSRAQTIQKFSVLPRDFSIAGGELGPTLKLKRQVVANMYELTIDAFYKE